MQYKGEDLDLRVPSARIAREPYVSAEYESAVNGRLSRPSPPSGDPIWVDEIVLQCCNYAFDIAMAHAASEVGVEHLVHALTRVDAAARILESRGVREGQLRRESAALLASEIPASQSADRAPPRRSADLEDVLRRATEIGGRRGLAASVDDIVTTVLTFGRELPAVALLRRLSPDMPRPEWARPRPELLLAETRVVEPARAIPSAGMETLLPRIGAIEDGVRALHAELASDRRALADLIRDTQREVVAQRTDARMIGQIAERFQALEKAVHGGLGEGARNWLALGQKMQAFETALAARDSEPRIVERLSALENALQARAEETTRGNEGLAEHIKRIEGLVGAAAGEGGRHWIALSERIGTIETILKSRSAEPQAEAGPLIDRLAGLERAVRAGFGESAQMTLALGSRLEGVEKSAAPADASEALLLIEERLSEIERLIDGRAREAAGLTGTIADRLVAIEARVASGAPVVSGMNDNVPSTATDLVRVADEGHPLARLVRETSDRVALLDELVRTAAAATDEALRTRDREIADMHDAIVRLAENQHTLASAIADWRNEVHTDFGTVNDALSRLGGPAVHMPMPAPADTPAAVIVPASVEPLVSEPMPEAVVAGSDVMVGDMAPEPDSPSGESEQWTRVWYWLFGTASVRKANREASLRFERLQQSLKDSRARRRNEG